MSKPVVGYIVLANRRSDNLNYAGHYITDSGRRQGNKSLFNGGDLATIFANKRSAQKAIEEAVKFQDENMEREWRMETYHIVTLERP